MKRLVLAISLLAISGSCIALDIAKAYKLIPHQQTPFYLSQSNLPAAEAKYVAKLLSLSELAMAERVEAMINGPAASNYDADINKILKRLDALQTPNKLKAVYQHIVIAIQQHREVFKLRLASSASLASKQQQLIQTSHRHLITAYQILKQQYPDESRHNQQAFFDYLCALDFI